MVESDPNMCAAMMMFGNSFGHDDERQQGCARFECSLYGNNTKIRTEFGTNCSAARMHTPAICRQPKMLSSTMSHEQITRPAFGTMQWKRHLIRQVHMVMAGMRLTVTYPCIGWTSSLHQRHSAIHQWQLPQRSLCRRQVFLPK